MNINQNFNIQPPHKLISLLGNLFDFIIKTIKLLHNIPKVNTNQFAIYHLYYKDEFSNQIWSFVFVADNIHFLCNLSNLSIALSCAAKPSFVIKKRELPRNFLNLLFYQSPFLFLSLPLLEFHLAIFKMLAIPQYALVACKWQFSSILAREDCKYLIFT